MAVIRVRGTAKAIISIDRVRGKQVVDTKALANNKEPGKVRQ